VQTVVQSLVHLGEWLSLTVPGAALAFLAWRLVPGRGRHGAPWWARLFRWLGGIGLVAVLAAAGFGLTALVIRARLATCEAGPEPWTCHEHTIPIAWPVVIGLIALGAYLTGPWIVWGARRLRRAWPAKQPARRKA